VLSLSALGQSFAYTFHEGLRRSRGDVETGPPLRTALLLSTATGVFMAAIAAALWVDGFDRSLWLTFAWLAPVSFLRTLSSVSTVVLTMQHRDLFRLTITAISLVTKVGLIVVLSSKGAPGAAAAFLVADSIMSAAYALNVYRRPTRQAPSDG
jgi:O-antigen/teichoic acid export membrane protein